MGLNGNLGELLNMETGELATEGTVVANTSLIVAERQNDTILDRKYQEGELRLNRVLETGEDALNRMAEIADQDEKARSYEVVANLMKTVAEVEQDRLDIAERRRGLKRDMDQREEEAAEKTTVNNTLIINGSTAEVQDHLSKLREK